MTPQSTLPRLTAIDRGAPGPARRGPPSQGHEPRSAAGKCAEITSHDKRSAVCARCAGDITGALVACPQFGFPSSCCMTRFVYSGSVRTRWATRNCATGAVGEGVELAPLSDLVSTSCYETLDRAPTQRVFGVSELDVITTQELIEEGISSVVKRMHPTQVRVSGEVPIRAHPRRTLLDRQRSQERVRDLVPLGLDPPTELGEDLPVALPWLDRNRRGRRRGPLLRLRWLP